MCGGKVESVWDGMLEVVCLRLDIGNWRWVVVLRCRDSFDRYDIDQVGRIYIVKFVGNDPR